MPNIPGYKATFYFLTALLISAILVRVFVFDSFTVVGNSMAPTIQEGDHVFVNKTAYWFKSPSRKDIVVGNFRDLEDKKAIKRVVALPGEWLLLENGKLSVSAERDVAHEDVSEIGSARTDLDGANNFTYRLDPYEYFLSGDNEISSIDSYELGPVDIYNIDGKVTGFFRLSELKYTDL